MISDVDVALRLLAAVLAGAVLGWEREAQRKPAGLRTHILVTLGSAAFLLAGLKLHRELVVANHLGGADPLKIIAGIVGGIGFLGAGSILRERGGVHGLTTAATIWLAAAIGVACGLGYFALAGACVLLAFGTLLLMGVLERTLFRSPLVAPAEDSDFRKDGPPLAS